MSTNTTHPGSETTSSNWSFRCELLRQRQWQESENLLITVGLIRNQIYTDPSPSPASLHREASQLTQLAFKLARQACGLDTKKTEVAPAGPPPLTPEEEADLTAAYGPSNPATDNLFTTQYCHISSRPKPATPPANAAPSPAQPSPSTPPPATPAPQPPATPNSAEAAPAAPASATQPTPSPADPLAPAQEPTIQTQHSKIPSPAATAPPISQPSTCDSGAQQPPGSSANPQPASQPAPAPQSRIETQNSTIPPSPSAPKQSQTGPVTPQPGEAGTTLNAQPTPPPAPAAESKIEPQNSTIPPNLPSPFSYERSPINTHPNSHPVPSLEDIIKTIRSQTPFPPNPQPANPPASQFIIEPENPEIQPALPEARGAFYLPRQPVAVVLQLYQQLSGLQLEIDPSVPKGALVTAQSGPSVTRTESLRLLEGALRSQAGVLLTPLGGGRARVVCHPARRQSCPPDRAA